MTTRGIVSIEKIVVRLVCSLMHFGEALNWFRHSGKIFKIMLKETKMTKISILFYLKILLLGIYPKDIYAKIFIVAVCVVVKNQK